MNDTIITTRQIADLKNILDEIRRVANQTPNISREYDTSPTDGERFSRIERLARKAMRNIP